MSNSNKICIVFPLLFTKVIKHMKNKKRHLYFQTFIGIGVNKQLQASKLLTDVIKSEHPCAL